MVDVRSFFDKTYLGAWDIPEGKDVVLVIDRCEGTSVKGVSGESKKAPILYFTNTKNKKGLVLNVTNSKTLIRLYGRHVEQWRNKPISAYATKVLAFGEEVDAIRIRPEAPAMPKASVPPPLPSAGREPGEEA